MVDDEEFAAVVRAPVPAASRLVDEQQISRHWDASAVIPSQAVPVVGVPNYPDCIRWSEENLLAVGSGHLVTILDPASMGGPRGFIPIGTSPIFDFGKVHTEGGRRHLEIEKISGFITSGKPFASIDLKALSLFQVCLARDPRPGVRSIDWSPPGLAPNGGSLLAVCTTDSRVKVYRTPFCDFQSEWVEIIDLSNMVFDHCLNNDFREAEQAAAQLTLEEETISSPRKWGFRIKRKFADEAEPQHRKVQKARHPTTGKLVGGDIVTLPAPDEFRANVDQQRQARVVSDEAHKTFIGKGSRVEVLEEDGDLQYWVGGLVAEIVNGEALVKLDRPQYGAMQEWVPLHETSETDNEETEEPSHGCSGGQRDGKQVMQRWRPRIRPQIDMETLEIRLTDEAGGERSLVSGEFVEAWINGRWQEGTVLEVHGSSVLVNFSASSMNTLVELRNLRLAPFWHGKRWIWKTISAVANQKTSVACHNTFVSTTVERMVNDLLKDSSQRQCVGQKEGQSQGLGGANNPGQMPTTLLLYKEQDFLLSPAQPGSGQESGNDIIREAKEKSYSRVYKRRGLATSSPPGDSLGTTRPTRTRRLPSKFRTEDTVSWIKDADGSMLSEHDLTHENVLNDKDGDCVQKVKAVKDGTKTKYAKLLKDTAKVKEAKNATDASILKEAKRDTAVAKEQHDSNDSRMKNKGISPHVYAARSEFLAPLSIAWSSQYGDHASNDGSGGLKPRKFALLGAGMKSGRVSLWRMACPSVYSIDNSHVPVAASFLGFLFAHESWVTNLSWASCCNFDLGRLNSRDFPEGYGSLGDTLLLATGCSDGSVKLWAGLSTKLAGSNCVPFVLLKEVVEADWVPVTALAIFVPQRSRDRALLAVGKGSGSVGVWELKSSGILRQICSQPRAHQQMVTGLSWTADGRCLYSSGQVVHTNDSLKRWDVSHQLLLPLPFPDGSSVFPPNTPSDICSLETLESYFGVTLSPSGLALAAVRGIASDLLDQMYQARSQKGMVQLFWLGNEHIDVNDANHASLANIARSAKAMSGYDLACWELNLIDALEALEDPRKRLVLWDVVAALSSLKERLGTEGVVSILSKWLSRWAPGQGAVGAVDSHEWTTGSFQKAIPEASCRRLQLLNVLYRRLFLSHVKTDMGRASSEDSSKRKGPEAELWMDGLYLVEHELRQRLVHLNLRSAAYEGHNFNDIMQGHNCLGIKLIVEWVVSNAHSVNPQLVKLATMLQAVNGTTRVNPGISSPMEVCTFCDSSVSLESPEIATCFGPGKHRSGRCSVSMQVCPPVCSWHCSCCGRSAMKQPFSLFFSLSSWEQIAGLFLPVFNHDDSFPFCPFCGILMHRLLPNFFLTPSLV